MEMLQVKRSYGFVVSRALVLCVALFALSFFGQTRSAYGQATYEPPRPVGDAWKDPRAYRQFTQDKSQIMFGRKPVADRDQFFDYYNSLLIAKLTDPQKYGKDFPNIRKEMMRDLTNNKVPSLRSDLIDLYVTELGAIAKGNYHPAARVNALVLLGSLNTTERTPAGKPALPYQPILADLQNTFAAAAEPLGIRLAALMGVLRHVESDWLIISNGGQPQVPDATKDALRAAAAQIITANAAPDGVKQRSWDYFRARTMDLFGSLVAFTPSKDELAVIVSTASQKDTDMLLRSRAVFALGRQKYAEIAEVDGEVVVGALVAYVADACQQAIDDVETLRKANQMRKEGALGSGGLLGSSEGDDDTSGGPPGGGMGSMYGGIAGGGGAASGGIEAYELEMLRRQLLYHLFSADRAIVGPRDDAFPGAKHFATAKHFAELEAQLNALEESANDLKLDTDALIREVKRSRSDLAIIRGEEEEAPVAKPVDDPIF